jgi:hypothetical protein
MKPYRESAVKCSAVYAVFAMSPHDCVTVFRNESGAVCPHGRLL